MKEGMDRKRRRDTAGGALGMSVNNKKKEEMVVVSI